MRGNHTLCQKKSRKCRGSSPQVYLLRKTIHIIYYRLQQKHGCEIGKCLSSCSICAGARLSMQDRLSCFSLQCARSLEEHFFLNPSLFSFQVEDLARLNKTEELYTNNPWYKVLKSRWSNYYDSLEKFWLKMFFRSKSGGLVLSKT